jgi:hypothetical protein
VLLASTVVCARWFFTDAELREIMVAVAPIAPGLLRLRWRTTGPDKP